MSQPIETTRQEFTEQALSLGTGPVLPAGIGTDARERAYWRRRLGQLNRKKRGA
jgi:hypothetical protein